MQIILLGSPNAGFVAVGPYADGEAEDGYCQLCTRYGGRYGGYSTEDAWVLPVQGPGDAAGTAVGIRGGISGEFEFHGPFPDIEAARTWASHFGGQAMKLHAPVRSKAA
jgi:hypothetical protein